MRQASFPAMAASRTTPNPSSSEEGSLRERVEGRGSICKLVAGRPPSPAGYQRTMIAYLVSVVKRTKGLAGAETLLPTAPAIRGGVSSRILYDSAPKQYLIFGEFPANNVWHDRGAEAAHLRSNQQNDNRPSARKLGRRRGIPALRRRAGQEGAGNHQHFELG